MVAWEIVPGFEVILRREVVGRSGLRFAVYGFIHGLGLGVYEYDASKMKGSC